jgi:3-isopropylmalate dehydrogenase
MRFKLDLYVNLRPIKLLRRVAVPAEGQDPKDVDMVFVRENTEDAYAGIHGITKKGTPRDRDADHGLHARAPSAHPLRVRAGARARQAARQVTLIDKANAVRAQDIWTRTFAEVAKEYPDIKTDHAYIDAACMWMVKNPEWFDVAVTPNLFGDIITDLGAMVQGGMGIAASGNIHPGKVSMFEPIHGSAPKYKGQNKANPIARSWPSR